MTPKEQLLQLLKKTYTSEDGDEYQIELKPGLSEQEVEDFEKLLPTKQIPKDHKELLQFTSGFDFYGIDEVSFDAIGQFGFEEFFPNSIQLAGDGFGNFWILDIYSTGEFGNVFYVCHDPPVIVKHSENILQFIQHIDEYGSDHDGSNLNIIHEETVFDIWEKNNGFTELSLCRESDDPILKEFALSLPDNFVIADLRNKNNKAGFAWGKFGADIDGAKRCKDELLWGIPKKEKQKGFLSKMFG